MGLMTYQTMQKTNEMEDIALENAQNETHKNGT